MKLNSVKVVLGIVATLSFLYTAQFSINGVKITLPGLCFLMLSLIALIGFIIKRDGLFSKGINWRLLAPAFLFLLAILLSGINAVNKFAWAKDTLHVAILVLTCSGLSLFFGDKRIIKNVMITYVIVLTLLSIWGIYQFVTFSGPVIFKRDYPLVCASANMGRTFAQFIYVAIIFCAILYSLTTRLFWKVICLLTITILTIALSFSITRGGIICVAISMILLLIFRFRKYIIPAIVVTVILLLTIFYIIPSVVEKLPVVKKHPVVKKPSVVERPLPIFNRVSTIDFRLEAWGYGIRFFKMHPLTGIGFNNFLDNVQNQNWKISYHGVAEDPHNFYLRLLAETGIIGLGTWLILIFSIFIYIWRIRKDEIGIGILALFVGWLVFASFGVFLAGARSTIFIIICSMGIGLVTELERNKKRTRKSFK